MASAPAANRYAILCGSAPENFRQTKLVQTYDFLASEKGGLQAQNIIDFPNGINELLLESTLNNLIEQGADEIFLYFFLSSSFRENSETILLREDEIRRDILEYYENHFTDTKFNFLYEVCPDFVSDESLGYEKCAL